jgi:hypothetical protein
MYPIRAPRRIPKVTVLESQVSKSKKIKAIIAGKIEERFAIVVKTIGLILSLFKINLSKKFDAVQRISLNKASISHKGNNIYINLC